MGKVSRTLTLLVVLGFMAGCAQMPVAPGGAQGTPGLNRILAKKELVVGTAASMPPLNMQTIDGQIIGMEPDLAALLADALNVKLTLKAMAFNDLIPALEAGQIDLILSQMTITPARNAKVAFVGPYFVSGMSILTKSQNMPTVKDIKVINSPERVLAALKGSTGQLIVEKLMPRAKLVLAETTDQAVAMVLEDKVAAMVADYSFCLVSVYRNQGADLVTLQKPLTYEPIGIGLPGNDPLLMNWLQNSLNTLEKSGELDRLQERWFTDVSWLSRLR